MGAIYIGTSGFSYREWMGNFYPRGLKGRALLNYYAANFNAVELNNTFYQLPSSASLNLWKDSVGPGFRFAIKASQLITHRKDFGIPDGHFDLFLSRISLLASRLGPVLFQFPPSYGNPERIIEFIKHMQALLPSHLPLTPVIELRNKKLLNQSFFDILREYRLNLCINDAYLELQDWPEPLEIVYLRLRNGPYSTDYLREIAVLLKQWESQGKDCYVFFKHEVSAPGLAKELIAILEQTSR
jgi:uncharacterized protein YecE (DUF72 family)